MLIYLKIMGATMNRIRNGLFTLHSPFEVSEAQQEVIDKLVKAMPGVSTLMGVTGSGKTFTMANIIAAQNNPVLVLAPNKTLAAQLYEEFSLFFPENKICYFVSYYDYYQPESYLPAQDIYIPKETKVNRELDRLRIESTASLINRKDTIVIASVSSIYSLGNPTDYRDLALSLKTGQQIKRKELIDSLVFIQYIRNDIEKMAGAFQVMGNVIIVNLPYQKERLRIELFGDLIESLEWIGKLDNTVYMNLDNTVILPAKHFVTPENRKNDAIRAIQADLDAWASQMSNPLYRDRIEKRVTHDIEMMKEMGYVSGIENYSIYFDGRKKGERPFCLFDFFPKDFLLLIDESHITIPQFRGMYAGDAARKKSLIECGFRLPSARDNRPLKFEEIESFFTNVIFVSATPSEYELTHSTVIAEQIIRPTGLLDPEIFVHPRIGQIDYLLEQIKETTDKGFRSLVMVMTKKMAEELARYLEEKQIRVCYLHSDLKTPERTEILQKLRLGIFDCLVGVNLLREGIDLPEVALVAIMDADLESFLRDKRSLIQIIGRAARNAKSRVILFADKITKSMQFAMQETERRRSIQQAYNTKHGIEPTTVTRDVTKSITDLQKAIQEASKLGKKKKVDTDIVLSELERQKRIMELEVAMQKAAEEFDFEKAIKLRGEWQALQLVKK